ncbi:uncharacterized protein SOCEGT47_021640 [Sorangium cellulosum]|uniref:Sulfatase-modifying factor enzyme domain-containing protein n=1 Tax=Sorangium cellulosum TaxID=56 RepID=A0A4P2PXV7_SORCE|nr:uncharacterized protein SOCEGT47_021640 [Sorangium cellulosum]
MATAARARVRRAARTVSGTASATRHGSAQIGSGFLSDPAVRRRRSVREVDACRAARASAAARGTGRGGARAEPGSRRPRAQPPSPGCRQGACVPTSCQGGEADGVGMSCGVTGDQDCCAADVVPGGTFYRSNDTRYPATISELRLDRYEVTVGRFRRFVEALKGTRADPPPLGAGSALALRTAGGSSRGPPRSPRTPRSSRDSSSASTTRPGPPRRARTSIVRYTASHGTRRSRSASGMGVACPRKQSGTMRPPAAQSKETIRGGPRGRAASQPTNAEETAPLLDVASPRSSRSVRSRHLAMPGGVTPTCSETPRSGPWIVTATIQSRARTARARAALDRATSYVAGTPSHRCTTRRSGTAKTEQPGPRASAARGDPRRGAAEGQCYRAVARSA